MAQHITVKEYDPAWQELYEREKALALACYDGSRNRL